MVEISGVAVFVVNKSRDKYDKKKSIQNIVVFLMMSLLLDGMSAVSSYDPECPFVDEPLISYVRGSVKP